MNKLNYQKAILFFRQNYKTLLIGCCVSYLVILGSSSFGSDSNSNVQQPQVIRSAANRRDVGENGEYKPEVKLVDNEFDEQKQKLVDSGDDTPTKNTLLDSDSKASQPDGQLPEAPLEEQTATTTESSLNLNGNIAEEVTESNNEGTTTTIASEVPSESNTNAKEDSKLLSEGYASEISEPIKSEKVDDTALIDNITIDIHEGNDNTSSFIDEYSKAATDKNIKAEELNGDFADIPELSENEEEIKKEAEKEGKDSKDKDSEKKESEVSDKKTEKKESEDKVEKEEEKDAGGTTTTTSSTSQSGSTTSTTKDSEAPSRIAPVKSADDASEDITSTTPTSTSASTKSEDSNFEKSKLLDTEQNDNSTTTTISSTTSSDKEGSASSTTTLSLEADNVLKSGSGTTTISSDSKSDSETSSISTTTSSTTSESSTDKKSTTENFETAMERAGVVVAVDEISPIDENLAKEVYEMAKGESENSEKPSDPEKFSEDKIKIEVPSGVDVNKDGEVPAEDSNDGKLASENDEKQKTNSEDPKENVVPSEGTEIPTEPFNASENKANNAESEKFERDFGQMADNSANF